MDIRRFKNNVFLFKLERGAMVKKILIVDDNFEDLSAIKEALKSEKYEVTGATNGAQALDFLKDNRPDLILLDIKMPTLSGYDLLRLLREKLNHKVPMIYTTIIPKKEVDMTDIDGFVQKPFSPAILLKEIKKIFK